MNSSSILEYVKSHPFFSKLDESYIELLCDAARIHTIGDGDVLFRQAEPAKSFYIVREGEVAVQVPAIMGPTLEIQTVGENQILGWSWLIPPYRWHFMAVAEKDSTLIEFDGTTILQRCEQNPTFGYQLLKLFAGLMSERLEGARRRMMEEWNPPGFA